MSDRTCAMRSAGTTPPAERRLVAAGTITAGKLRIRAEHPAAADDPSRIPPRAPHASDGRTGWEAAPRHPHTGSLDPTSSRWVELYREYSAVRPNVSALVLVAEVENEMAGAA